MKDKLEVGIYVRTEEGKIFKTDGDKLYLRNDKKILYRLLTRIPHDTANYKVIKASHNIIDLLEVGDYVNGFKVVDFDVTYFNGVDRREEPKRIGIKVINGKFDFGNQIKANDIKSIVTKEQFSIMSYKLGDDK